MKTKIKFLITALVVIFAVFVFAACSDPAEGENRPPPPPLYTVVNFAGLRNQISFVTQLGGPSDRYYSTLDTMFLDEDGYAYFAWGGTITQPGEWQLRVTRETLDAMGLDPLPDSPFANMPRGTPVAGHKFAIRHVPTDLYLNVKGVPLTTFENATNGGQVRMSPFEDIPEFWWGLAVHPNHLGGNAGAQINDVTFFNGPLNEDGTPTRDTGVLTIMGRNSEEPHSWGLQPSRYTPGLYAVRFLRDSMMVGANAWSARNFLSNDYRNTGPFGSHFFIFCIQIQ